MTNEGTVVRLERNVHDLQKQLTYANRRIVQLLDDKIYLTGLLQDHGVYNITCPKES